MDSDLVEIRGENEEEEEEEEDGPPPGFNCITSATQQEAAMAAEKNGDEDSEEEDDDEGPPPGWSPIPPSVQPIHTSDVEMLSKEEADEDEDRPPPGWDLPQSTAPSAGAVPELENIHEDNEEEGPPPGWESISPQKQTPLSTKTLPPPSIPVTDVGRKQEDKCSRDEGAQASLQSSAPPPYKPVLPTPTSLPCSSTSFTEKGQMICGSCRRLLSYPRGAKHVKCSCCQTVNLVLEAHQIGQVKCGSCAVLLMYSYGAPAVRCSSCRHVTEIGAHNKRPPLAVQQERRLPSFNRVH